MEKDSEKRIKVRIPEIHGPSEDYYSLPETSTLTYGYTKDEDLPWLKVPITPGFSSTLKKQLYPKGYSVYVTFPTGEIGKGLILASDYVESNLALSGSVGSVSVDGTIADSTEAAEKLWAAGKARGMTDAECAGMLGNIKQESGYMDPTTVEGRYDEPFKIGPKKEEAVKDGVPSAAMTAYFWKLKAYYDSYNKSIAVSAYRVGDGSDNYCVGLGLIGWTGPTGVEIVKYAQQFGKVWYDFAAQVANFLGGGTTYKRRFNIFLEKANTNKDSVDHATACWLGIMEMGLNSPSTNSYSWGYSNRLKYAKEWYSEFASRSAEICSKHSSFANGVTSMINSNAS